MDRVSRDPDVLGGEPVVSGTRIPIRAIIMARRLYRSTKRVGEAFPAPSPEDIKQALEFYRQNRAEIERYIALNDLDQP